MHWTTLSEVRVSILTTRISWLMLRPQRPSSERASLLLLMLCNSCLRLWVCCSAPTLMCMVRSWNTGTKRNRSAWLHLNSFQNRVFNKYKLLNTDLVWHLLMCQDCLTGDRFIPSWLWNLSSFSQGCQSWRRVPAVEGFHPLLPVMK